MTQGNYGSCDAGEKITLKTNTLSHILTVPLIVKCGNASFSCHIWATVPKQNTFASALSQTHRKICRVIVKNINAGSVHLFRDKIKLFYTVYP